MTADDVRARFEAWLKANGIEIFPNWRENDLAVVSVGKLMKIAHADRDAEVRELVEALKLARDYAAYVQGEPDDLAVMDAALAKHTHQEKP